MQNISLLWKPGIESSFREIYLSFGGGLNTMVGLTPRASSWMISMKFTLIRIWVISHPIATFFLPFKDSEMILALSFLYWRLSFSFSESNRHYFRNEKILDISTLRQCATKSIELPVEPKLSHPSLFYFTTFLYYPNSN